MSNMILKEWHTYQKAVFAGAPQAQLDDLKQTFFAGAMTFWQLILKNADASGDVTDLDLTLLKNLLHEMDDYFRNRNFEIFPNLSTARN